MLLVPIRRFIKGCSGLDQPNCLRMCQFTDIAQANLKRPSHTHNYLPGLSVGWPRRRPDLPFLEVAMDAEQPSEG